MTKSVAKKEKYYFVMWNARRKFKRNLSKSVT